MIATRDAAEVDALRSAFRAAVPHRVSIREAITQHAAHALRIAAEQELAPYEFASRGRYYASDRSAPPELIAALRGLAEAIVERPLTPSRTRVMRLRHGDYQLMRGDIDTRELDRHIEATLDFSSAALPDAEFAYVSGAVNTFIEQVPRSIVIVERDAELLRYDSYLKNQVGDGEVWRLQVALRFQGA